MMTVVFFWEISRMEYDPEIGKAKVASSESEDRTGDFLIRN